MKKFMKKTEGFTLVELIVVIAILGILAGVGTVGYSGYIKKANQAADNQLVAALNYAYAAACLENGVDATTTTAANITVGSDKKVGETDIAVSNPAAKADDIKAAFAKYYAGNENAEFKVATKLTFANGMFVADFAAGATKAVTIGGKTYNISQKSIDNFKAATVFSQNIGQMQGQVDSLTSAYGGVVGIFEDDELANAFGGDYVDYLNSLNIADGDNTAIGNATVLYVARQSGSMTAESAMKSLSDASYYLMGCQTAGKTPDLFDMLAAAGSTADPLATTAMMYGAVTAYANGSDAASAATLKTKAQAVNNSATLMDLFITAAQDESFLDYCGTFDYNSTGVTAVHPTEGFVRDMNGYLGALDALNTVSDQVELSTENVWSSDKIDDALEEILK